MAFVEPDVMRSLPVESSHCELFPLGEPDVMGSLGNSVDVDRSTVLILALSSCAILLWKL